MKKIVVLIIATTVVLLSTGCKYEEWPDGIPEYEHVYYIHFKRTFAYTDYLRFEIASNGNARWGNGAILSTLTWATSDEPWVTSDIPFQFFSERVRSYDVVTYFWVFNKEESALTPGVDYTVIHENGTILTPNANGAYSLTWPKAIKGVQNIKIRRSAGSPGGELWVSTFQPGCETPTFNSPSTAIITQTSEYEIWGSAGDYEKVDVIFTN